MLVLIASILLVSCASAPQAQSGGGQEIVVLYSAVSGLYEVFFPLGDNVKQVTIDGEMQVINTQTVSLKTGITMLAVLEKMGYITMTLKDLSVPLMVAIAGNMPTFVFIPVSQLPTPVKD